MVRKIALVAVLVAAGCTLYNEVAVSPLNLLPTRIERGSDLASMLRKADYIRAMEMAGTIDANPRRTAADLASLGTAFLAAGRFDDARARLRAALDLQPFRTTYAQIAWDLSQVEYLSNNYESSLEWAKLAAEHGLSVRKWHTDYLESLAKIAIYDFKGETTDRIAFKFGKPDVPRITTRLNGKKDAEAIIDSGAVLSIISQRLASSLNVKSLGNFEGTFYGLLGEPIAVRFGILDRLDLGSIAIENVPVAIMPDDKMKFLISKRERIEFRMDFLLGTNLLKEFRIDLDFKSGRVTFTRLTPADRKFDDDQNLFFQGFRPYVRGAVNRHAWYMFVLDTGSEITFLNQSRLGALPMNIFSSGAHSATLQGLGGAMKHGAKLEDVEIGIGAWGGKFKTLPMYSSAERETAVGIIGQNFLKNFHVVIDFGRMRVDLKRR